MKQMNNVWHFESHEELESYLAQKIDGNKFGHHVYLSTMQNATVGMDGIITADTDEEGRPYVLTDEDMFYEYNYLGRTISRDHSIRAAIGHVSDYPAEDFAVKRPWRVVELEAPTAVEGFYKAGVHLADRCYTIGQKQTQFTTKELTAVKKTEADQNDPKKNAVDNTFNSYVRISTKATDNHYTAEEILKWMKMFYKRFFSQQFKRSCMPDGVKVGTVSLSPRGDWRMPSDAAAYIWMKELENINESE